MEKKLLSVYLLFSIFFLSSWSGFGQDCPTSVSISSDKSNNICAGTPVTFTANVNGGTGTFTYQWKIDGTVAGTNSNIFTTSSLDNGDKITVSVIKSGENTCTISSSSYTMTVNANQTPTVTISPSKTSICPGESVTFTANNTNGGTSPQYAFYLNSQTTALQSGSSNQFTTTTLNNGDRIRVVLTSSLTCTTSDTDEGTSTNITVRAGTPANPGTIATSVGSSICPGTSQTYSISAVTGATSYQWILPSGWSGSSSSTSITATAGTAGGTVSVKAVNDCGTGEAQTLDITVKAGTPAMPGNITGETAVCPGVSQTYSIEVVPDATEYIWTLPNGWTGTSTTNSINVTPGASGSGNISVQAKNECGTSTAKTLAVSVKPGTPATPGVISGTAAVCPGTQQTYSITGVTGATSYIWTLPNGWTGTSTINSITATSGTTGGNISVKAINDCGTSIEQTIAVTVKPGTPTQPAEFTAGPAEVCPGTTATYTVPAVKGAISYIWTIPSGFTAQNLTTTTPSLTVTAGSSGLGNITVKATNDCGTSTTARTIAVTISKPAPVMSGSITGPAKVCSTATGLVYSIPAITNATEYVWTLPTGWNITAGGTTRSITVSAGSTSANGSPISVVAKNSCGTSSSASILVKAFNSVPAKPGDISTTLTTSVICPPINGIKFSVPIDNSGTVNSYNWILPSGFQIVSGANTNEITVNITTTAAYGSNIKVEVEAVNSCGPSQRSTYTNINLDKFVVTDLKSDQTVCSSTSTLNLSGNIAFGTGNTKLKISSITSTGTNQVQGIPSGAVNDFTYQYTPSSQDLTAGKVTFTLTTEKPAGACAAGTDQMTVFFKPLPTATISSTGPICNGNTSTLTFTGTPNSRVTYKLPSGTNQTVDIGTSGTATVTTAALTANATYTLVSAVNLDTPACSNTLTGSTTVTVTPKPTATITYAGTPFCNSLTTAQNPTLTGTNAYTGGTYGSTTGLTIDTSTGAINPSTSTPGTYTVTYSTPQGGGCAPITATTQVTITKAPTAAISYTGGPFCTSDSTAKSVTLTGTDGFSGGVFSAPAGLTINSSTGAITANSSTAGTYLVTYNTPTAGGCSPVAVTTEVTITKAPTVTGFSYPDAPFCKAANAEYEPSLAGTDAYTGGTYSAPAGLSINSSTGKINPFASTVGTYTVTYKSPVGGGCEEVTATTEVTITQTPAAEISYAGPFCNNDDTLKTVTFSNTAGAYTGGTFSYTSSSGLSINGSTGEINANTSSPGTYTVVYTIPEGEGCTTSEISTQVTITESPDVDISYTTPLCTSDNAAYPVTFSNGFGAYQGGTFTGTNGISIDATGIISPSTSTPGVHTITYTTIAAEGCGTFQTTTEVEIFQEVVITTEPVNVGICSTEPAIFEVVASGDNLSYQWKRTDGAAITNATGVNTSKLSFSNATAVNAGEYFVEVSGSSPCSMEVSEPVTLNIDENIIIIKPTEDLSFCDDTREEVSFEFIAHAKGAVLTFTWIKDGNEMTIDQSKYITTISEPLGENGEYTGTLTIKELNLSDNGVYAVRIEGPDYFTCSAATSKTFRLDILPLPTAPNTENITYCQNATADPLTAAGENLTWYDSNKIKIEGIPTPGTSESNIGNTVYYVTQKNNFCESTFSELIVTVKPTPAAPTTSQAVAFCYNEVVTTPLSATASNTASTLNWYGPNDQTAVLDGAPIPLTTTTGTTKYWVSETFEGCESPLVEIVITINPLPTITVTADPAVICEGSTTTLRANGGISYEWFIGETSVGTGADFPVSPLVTTTYKVIGTSDKGCKNSTEITIKVDEPTQGGSVTGPGSVCTGTNSGSLTLSGNTGVIQRWEKSIDGGTTWTSINETSATLSFTNLAQNTTFRAFSKNGVCTEVPSDIASVTIDPLPIGGQLNFEGFGRIVDLCSNPGSGYSVPLLLSGETGTVLRWRYKQSAATSWSTVLDNGQNFTGRTLTAELIRNLGLNTTTIFEVEIQSGACTPNVFSQNATLSIISSDIAPNPVSVTPGVVCIGNPVTLSGSSGYGNGSQILSGGDFNSANSLTNEGWRVRRDGSTTNLDFPAAGSNTRPNIWSNANDQPFYTGNINGSGGSDVRWDSGDKKFGIVAGNNPSTLETPVFNTYAMESATFTFDQAYNLTDGAKIQVEISTDGGATYQTILYEASGPANSGSLGNFGLSSDPRNKISINLGSYLGQGALRIRFHFLGKRDGDVWTVDGISMPEGPSGVEIVWTDYTDPANPVVIGNGTSEQWTPRLIGWNDFEIRTRLTFDSTGAQCPVVENFSTIKAFVFDKYTSTATAVPSSCGNNEVQLNGEIINSTLTEVTEFPTKDNYSANWEVVTGPAGYTFSASHFTASENSTLPGVNDPNATFSPGVFGSYTIRWALNRPTDDGLKNETCPPIYTDVTIDINDCTALDFDGYDDYVDLGSNYQGNIFFEAWIRPFNRQLPNGSANTDASTGTIISGPGFEISMGDLPATITPGTRWYHIAVSNSGNLWVDGIPSGTLTLNGHGGNRTIIGARWNSSEKTTENHFSGWIEEVRIWSKELNEQQIRFMMNQRLISNGAKMGEQIPMDVPDGLTYADLEGYYRLISAEPEPLDVSPIIYLAEDMPANGLTPDRALNKVPGRLVNMETNQDNTAPLPYYSANDGAWGTDATWLRPDVWDPPHTGPIEWNIVRTSHNINSNREVKVLGLISTVNTLEMVGTNPAGWVGGGSGNPLHISHYLKLNGVIDLQGESQLIQPMGSIVDGSSTGSLQRDQQGTANSYNYNYWSSPVSPTAGSETYTVAGVLKDGTKPANPVTISFGDPYAFADTGKTNPIKISNYWISIFNGAADQYGEWAFKYGSAAPINVGEGYTMKGTSGAVALETAQNYTFVGLPNNGTIKLKSEVGKNYLLGNPYPSAINAAEFIRDNLANSERTGNYFDGTLYFWDHFGKKDSHVLLEYVGGYASLNFTGSVPAISIDERIDANLQEHNKKPGNYIPVGQGFFINSSMGDWQQGYTIISGDIIFENDQRIFVTEDDIEESQFLKPEEHIKSQKEPEIEKIRISYKSPQGYRRQILVGATPAATNGFDLGYDAPLFDYNKEDMYWIQDNNWLVIQGVSNFDKEQVLPLGIVLEKEGEFTIKIDTLENMEAGKNVYIRDILNDTIHNLTKAPFVATSKGGYINDRFEIVFYKEPPITPEKPTEPTEPIPGKTPPGIELEVIHGHSVKEFQILNPLQVDITNLYVYDLNGKLLQTYYNIINDKVVVLPVRNFSSGVYIVKLHAENQVISKKIIISN